ncbi:MAG TPA: histidine phosphatase family protein [Candidatus Saccharimonadales bacterium]|nr:histidine phosphatase family protein [Candidatus Saccharimonadales bacterium]
MVPNAVHLLLARHGQTDWNLAHRLQGRSEVPLNAAGRGEAEALAGRLAGEPLDRALVSPLGRARETAAAVEAARPGLRFEVEPRLAEVDMGAFEGRLEAELLAADESFRAWRADPVRHGCPGGEGALDVARRVAPLLDELAAAPPGSRVLLLGHQFTNAVIQCLATGTPLDQVRSLLAPTGELRGVDLSARAGG